MANQVIRTVRLTVLCLAGMIAGAGSSQAEGFRHVRSSEPDVQRMLLSGYQRSATLRALIDRLESTPCIVYIATVAKLSQGMEGALLSAVNGRPDLPILRVVITSSLAGDRAIAIIAHELQHVVEATGVPLNDSRSLTARFAALDADGSSSEAKFETDAARAVTVRVLEELHRSR